MPSAYYLMAFRFAIGTLLLGIFFRKRLSAVTRKDLVAGSVIGFFMFSAFAAQTIGLLYTTASKQAFLTGTNVVVVPFLVWALYRKKPDAYSFAATFIALGGIALLTLQGTLTIGLGDSLTLLCAVLFAGHIVSIGHFAKDQDPIVLAAIQMAFTTVFSFLFAALSGEPWKAWEALWRNHRPNSEPASCGSVLVRLPMARSNISWFSQSSSAARWRSFSTPMFCETENSR